jgi:capsular exopolysaccharide synthesis family protein
MELRDLIGALRRFWLIAVTVLVLVLAFGFAAAYIPHKRYQSTATLIATPASRQIDWSSVSAVQSLLPSFAAQVGTETFSNQVRTRVALTYPSLTWKDIALSGSATAGTSLLRVQVTATDPQLAAAAANVAADNLITTQISDLVQMKVIDRARPASIPVSPRRRLILFAATVIGLIGGVLAALGASALWPRVRTASEIRQRFGLEVLAEIPYVRDFPRRSKLLFDPVAGNHKLVEAFRRLHTNFEIVADNRPAVGVVSCTAGEGKSAVTANLAWAIASTNKQVVAIDTDLRRPTLHEYYGIRLEPGIADVPLGADIKGLVRDTELPTLHVIPAGNAVQHPTSIIYTALPPVLALFKNSLLLVDMPPLLGTAEATLVATAIKSVILVVDAHHGNPDELEQVLHELERANVQVLGVALNRARPRRSRRNDNYYGITSNGR